MSEVPEDITQAATRAIYRMPDRRDENINTSDFWDLIVLEVEKVILAERDQCAKIAEEAIRRR